MAEMDSNGALFKLIFVVMVLFALVLGIGVVVGLLGSDYNPWLNKAIGNQQEAETEAYKLAEPLRQANIASQIAAIAIDIVKKQVESQLAQKKTMELNQEEVNFNKQLHIQQLQDQGLQSIMDATTQFVLTVIAAICMLILTLAAAYFLIQRGKGETPTSSNSNKEAETYQPVSSYGQNGNKKPVPVRWVAPTKTTPVITPPSGSTINLSNTYRNLRGGQVYKDYPAAE
jgi:hypothetical protein